MVKHALRGYLALASGVTEVTAARARTAARVLVEQGESTAAQVTALAEDLVETSRRNREGLVLIVRHEVEATLRRLGLGAAGDVDALNQRVRRLEQALREVDRVHATTSAAEKDASAKARTSAGRPAAASASATKKAPAKRSTAQAAKKAPAKRSTAQAAKKATARSTGTKKPAAQKAASRTGAKKTMTKKTTATKSRTTRTTAKGRATKSTGTRRTSGRSTTRKRSS